jgi:hypothetical protein
MKQGMRRNGPALALAAIALALFVALGGSVYAATKGRIDGRAVRAKSLPGNRLKLHSVAGNRLKPHSIPAAALQPGALTSGTTLLTGANVDERTLGQVPRATHAETADFAKSADDAQTALNAVNAIDAQTVNGHGAGCRPGTRLFAGACWQAAPSFAAATAPQAAIECAKAGGELPGALELAAFALQPDVALDENGEWSGDIANVSGLNLYSAATVSPAGKIDAVLSTETRHYRCVIPLVV